MAQHDSLVERFSTKSKAHLQRAHRFEIENVMATYHQQQAEHRKGSIGFWEMHAAYWDERGKPAQATTCRQEAERARAGV